MANILPATQYVVTSNGSIYISTSTPTFLNFYATSTTATSSISGSLTVGRTLNITNNLNVSGNILASGASTSPSQEVTIVGDEFVSNSGTTSIITDSTTATAQSCIQMKSTIGPGRFYVTDSGG